MPKISNKLRKEIAPFLLSMLERGLTLRQIEEVLSTAKPLSHQAIRDILYKEFRIDYNKIAKGRRFSNTIVG